MRKRFLIVACLSSGALLSLGAMVAPSRSMPREAVSQCATVAKVTGNGHRFVYKNLNELDLSGNDNTVMVDGTCNFLSVTGNRNTIQVQRCDDFEIDGNFNRATLKFAQNITTPGNDNKVTWSKSILPRGIAILNTGSRNAIIHTRR